MYRRILVVMLLAGCLGLAACASKPPKPSAAQQEQAGANGSAASEGAEGGANANGGPFGNQSSVTGPQQGLLAKRTVYFDFDSAMIKGDGTDIVAAHAKYLSDHTDARVGWRATPTSAARRNTTSASAAPGTGRPSGIAAAGRLRGPDHRRELWLRSTRSTLGITRTHGPRTGASTSFT